MQQQIQPRLRRLGLSESEARVYEGLAAGDSLSAQDIADRVGLSRGSVYPALKTLVDAGLVEGGAGYGSRFRISPPETAFPSLIDRQREELLVREQTAKDLVEFLPELIGTVSGDDEQMIEILRSPRVIAERYQRLELDCDESMEVLVKPPIFARKGNPVYKKVHARGIEVRALYEPSVLEAPEVRPYIQDWVDAGERARVHPGELPIKLALFDHRVAMLPLETPDQSSSVTTMIIRHSSLGAALRVMFDCLWERSEDLVLT
jgi:HTH-type transcriptional regulator, sugar sensing transcriptional regulator